MNAINVYPVPDGDTGTNMLLTWRAAIEACEATPTRADALASALARGALLGARGNSGVILSQMVRGFAEACQGIEVLDGPDVARALAHASQAAYGAVTQPVEGTMLTVLREAAEAAVAARPESSEAALAAASAEAAASVARTPDLLPRLREAGVVDAGGQGVAVLLEGLRIGLTGEPLPEAAEAPAAPPVSLDAVEHEGHGYCVEYVVGGRNLDRDALRSRLERLGGESVLVVGDARLLRVHVHMADPGPALSLGAALGPLASVKVDNMQTQHEAWNAGHEAEQAASQRPGPALDRSLLPLVGLVAVAPGSGIAATFRALGAVPLLTRDGAKPSAGELLEAARNAGSERVVLLPNDKDVLLAAEQAAAASDGLVTVVPTRTIAAGLSAAIAYHPDGNPLEVTAAMVAASAGVRCVEVTRAARSTTVDGIEVTSGDPIAFLDGTLVARAETSERALLDALGRALAEAGAELVTLILGAESPADAAESTRALIEARHPELEVEVIEGGQPFYPYIAGIE